MLDSVRSIFNAWAFFVSLRGRLSRLPFALSFLGLVVFQYIATILVYLMAKPQSHYEVGAMIIQALAAWPRFSLLGKRLHDINRSVWLAVPDLALLAARVLRLLLLDTLTDPTPDPSLFTPRNLAALVNDGLIIYVAGLIVFLLFIPTRTGKHGRDMSENIV